MFPTPGTDVEQERVGGPDRRRPLREGSPHTHPAAPGQRQAMACQRSSSSSCAI